MTDQPFGWGQILFRGQAPWPPLAAALFSQLIPLSITPEYFSHTVGVHVHPVHPLATPMIRTTH